MDLYPAMRASYDRKCFIFSIKNGLRIDLFNFRCTQINCCLRMVMQRDT